MVQEILVQTVDPARRAEYIEVFKRALKEWSPKGNHGGTIFTCVEDPARVITILEWDTVEAHTQHRGTEPWDRFRAALAPYRTAPVDVNHYTGESA